MLVIVVSFITLANLKQLIYLKILLLNIVGIYKKYFSQFCFAFLIKFVLDHLKTKKMCKHVVKKSPYLIRYVPDQYKTEQMCDKAILEYGGTLKSVPDCCKNQEMCNKAVDSYPHALEFVSECYKTQQICDKVVNTCTSTIKFVPECFMTHEMCNKAVNRCFFVFDSIPDQYKLKNCFWRSFLIIYCPDKYKTQEMCDEAVDDSLAALTLIPDWFVTSKMIEKRFTALYATENILCFNEDSRNAVYNCNERGILNIDLNNNNLDNNFDEDDPDTIILVRLLAWHIKFEERKALKKELHEELMPVAWHPKRWWD